MSNECSFTIVRNKAYLETHEAQYVIERWTLLSWRLELPETTSIRSGDQTLHVLNGGVVKTLADPRGVEPRRLDTRVDDVERVLFHHCAQQGLLRETRSTLRC